MFLVLPIGDSNPKSQKKKKKNKRKNRAIEFSFTSPEDEKNLEFINLLFRPNQKNDFRANQKNNKK